MRAVLPAVVAVLAVVTGLNLVILLGVVRRLRTAPARPSAEAQLPPVGRRIAPFTAATVTGDRISDRDLATGTTLVVFVMPGCGPCRAIVDELAASAGPTGPRPRPLVFVAGDAAAEDTRGIVDALSTAARVAVIAPAGGAAAAFAVTGYPTVVRVEDGRVARATRVLGSWVPHPADPSGGYVTT